jgi:hypothetical protein
LRPVGVLAALDLNELLHEPPIATIEVILDGFALGLTLLGASEQFGVHLITSSDPKVAQENVIKAKSIAPEGSKILLYKRMNSLWATVVIYSDSLAASADLPKYTKDPDWRTAQVVYLERWCPKAEKLILEDIRFQRATLYC